MNRVYLLLCGVVLAAASTLPAHAQKSYVFTSFQCDPVSCSEEGPAEVQGEVTVNFVGDCTGNIVPVLAVNAQAIIGTPVACKTPYIPYALIQTSKTEYLDDCGDPYFVSYVTPNAEVFTPLGVVVYHVDATYGCDGSQTSPLVIGTKPC